MGIRPWMGAGLIPSLFLDSDREKRVFLLPSSWQSIQLLFQRDGRRFHTVVVFTVGLRGNQVVIPYNRQETLLGKTLSKGGSGEHEIKRRTEKMVSDSCFHGVCGYSLLYVQRHWTLQQIQFRRILLRILSWCDSRTRKEKGRKTMKKKDCESCLKRHGRKFDTTAEQDFGEGICPLRTDVELYHCPETGNKLKQRSKVKLVA